MRLALLWILFFIAFRTFAQSVGARYRIEFTDKAGTKYDLSHPGQFLSQRALVRRKRYQIPVDKRDLPVSTVYIDSLEKCGFRVLYTSRWFNFATVAVTSPEDTVGVASWSFIRSIKLTRPAVMLKNAVNKWTAIQAPSTGNVEAEPGATYGYAAAQIKQLNGTIFHDNNYRGQGMLIVLLDAGFRAVNKLEVFYSLFSQNRLLGTRDFVDPSSDVFQDYQHGMNVLSLMAANMPGTLVGTAPEASYFLIRTEDESSEYPVEMDNYIAGLELADSLGADVVNASLGYSDFDDPAYNLSYQQLDGKMLMISQAAELASQKGMIVCVSAGNEGDKPWNHIVAPADATGILSVAAVNISGEPAPFSSIGPSADGRIKPEVAACGWDTWIQEYPDGIEVSNGTSFATPLVAGLVACLWQEYPNLAPSQIIDAVERSASQYAAPDDILGYGIPDFRKASLLLQETVAKTKKPEWLVSPNPFGNELRLEYKGAGLLNDNAASYKLINGAGTILYEERLSGRIQLLNQFRTLPSGLYFLQIVTNGVPENHKLIKR